MLTFFRRIRKGLLGDGATSKYLLYAIGEIALVVIGILIALQVNNWNQKTINNRRGQELKNVLFEELLQVRQYNLQVIENELNVQIQIIEEILTPGKDLEIDLFISKHKDYWAVELLSLPTYIISFTTFYDPNIKLYKAAINDGSISLVKDKDYISGLETAYIHGPSSMERLYNREAENDLLLKEYVSHAYSDLFVSTEHMENGNWTDQLTKKFLERIGEDGEFRFKLRHKLGLVKSKKFILETQIIEVIDHILESEQD